MSTQGDMDSCLDIDLIGAKRANIEHTGNVPDEFRPNTVQRGRGRNGA
jgi:hypothetical protein